MKSFIKCFKLFKYSAQLKNSLFFMFIIGTVGFFLEFSASKDHSFIGGFYIFLFPVMIGQMLMTISLSGLVQSSYLKKRLQTLFPHIITFPITGLSLFIVIMHRAFMIRNGVPGVSDAENYSAQSVYIFGLGVLIFFSLIYFAVCYKFFVASLIVFFCIMIPGMIVMQNPYSPINQFMGRDFGVSVIAAIVLFLMGNIISLVLSNLLYKYELSEYMVKRTIGRMAK